MTYLLLLTLTGGVLTGQATQSTPKWQSYFNAAEKELDRGNIEGAKERYKAGLDFIHTERTRYSIGAIDDYQEMPPETEARASMVLATLIGQISLKTTNHRLQQEAESAFNTAIELSAPYASLQFQARNEYAVFLLQAGRIKEAVKLLATMQPASKSETSDAVATYEYNFGQALMQDRRAAEALPHYIASFRANPKFRLAANAALLLAQRETAAERSVQAIIALADISLTSSDTIGAAEYLQVGLTRPDWWEAESFPMVLSALVRLFIEINLKESDFRSDWAPHLESIGQSSIQIPALRAKSILMAYGGGDVGTCLPPKTPKTALTRNAPWHKGSETQQFSVFLGMIADQQFKADHDSAALESYLEAACLDSSAYRVKSHLANFFEQKPELWELVKKENFSPEVYATIADGFAILQNKERAIDAFLLAARESKSEQEIQDYMDQAIQLSKKNKHQLLQIKEDLIARLFQFTEPMTVTGQALATNRLAASSIAPLPNSRGSLSLASLITPNALGSHLSLIDSQDTQSDALPYAETNPRNNTLTVDNVVVQGPPEPDSSALYYDIDSLDSIDVIDGGPEPSLNSDGLHINLLTKNPGNQWAGSASYLSLLPDAGAHASAIASKRDLALGQPAVKTDQLLGNEEYSIQLGGPLKKERLWGWIAYSESSVTASALGGQQFQSHLSDPSIKLNASFDGADLLSLSSSQSALQDQNLGAGLTRAPETTLSRRGQSDIWRLDYDRSTREWSLSTQYSRLESRSSNIPRSQPNANAVLTPGGFWTGSFRQDKFRSKADQWQISGIYSPSGSGPLLTSRAGASLRTIDANARSSFGGNNSIYIAGENLGVDFDIARLYRSGEVEADTNQAALWLQDSLRFRRFTFDLGLRYDLQEGKNHETSAAANPIFPDLLPVTQTGRGVGRIRWASLNPRIGVTYGLTPNTLIRAGYSRFSSPLQLEYIQRTNPAALSYMQFGFRDSNGNGVLDPSERESLHFLSASGIDPANPESSNVNINTENLRPERTDEIILGFETSSSDTKIDLSATWRRVSHILELRTLIRDNGLVRLASSNDYVAAGTSTIMLPNGRQSSAEVFSLKPDLSYTGGSLLTNGDRRQEYVGLKIRFETPLRASGKLRGSLAYESSQWEIGPRFRSYDDPTRVVPFLDQSGISRADNSGDVVIFQYSDNGSAGRPALNSKWSANLNGTFELPLGVFLGMNFNFHQGYALPYFAAVLAPDGRERDIRVTNRSDSFQLPDIYVMDMRLQRTFSVRSVAATVGFDAFNLFNRNTPLQRILQINGPQPNYLAKTLSNRAVRLGVRFSWEH